MATLLRRANPETQERVARALVSDRIDTTSQGPINEIRRRSSGRLGGTIGVETPDTVLHSTRRPLRPVEDLEGGDFIGSVTRVGIQQIEESGRASRLTIRTVANDGMVAEISAAIRASGAVVEGVAPLGDGYSMVYIGYNNGERRLSRESQQALSSEALLKESLGRSTGELSDVLSGIRSGEGISYGLFDNKSNVIKRKDYAGIADLLRTFEYSREAAVRNATSGSNTTVLARDGSDIVGIAMTEHGRIELSNGRTVHTAELTDFVVRQQYSGNKISYVMASMLLNNLFRGNVDNDLFVGFAEARVSNYMITTFSMLGGSTEGLLPNHVNVRRSTESEMQSFAVMQFTREGVEQSPIQSILRA